MTRTAYYTLILLALTSPVFCRDASPGELLARAADADRHVDYRGQKTASITFGNGAMQATMKVIHLRPDMTRTIYFAPEALAGIVMIQHGRDLFKYRPKEDVWEPIRCPCPPGEGIHGDAMRNYDLKMLGTESVAGRTAYVIQALPRNQGEAAHRVWVDREYYLIIGTQVENDSGTVMRSSRYQSLQINPGDIARSLFEVKGKVIPAPKAPKSEEFKVLKPTYLPSGYRLVGVTNLNVNGRCCAHMQFSNGAATISLFQRRASEPAPQRQIKSKVTNVITWARGGMQFTIMGDISRAELQKMADSVK